MKAEREGPPWPLLAAALKGGDARGLLQDRLTRALLCRGRAGQLPPNLPAGGLAVALGGRFPGTWLAQGSRPVLQRRLPSKPPRTCMRSGEGSVCVGCVSSLKPGSFLLSPESGWALTWGSGSGHVRWGQCSRRAEASPFHAVPSSNCRDLQRCLNYWPCHKSAAETR